MARGATLALKITGDASGGLRALDEAEGRASKFGSVMGGAVVAGAAAGVAAIGLLGKASFDAASDLEQSTGAINSVFGDWALDIEQTAQTADKAVGLSTSSYEQLASVIGAQLHGAGMAHDEMTAKTQALIAKGADLAATFGGSTADAVEALSGVLKGETDPIERYGVSIKQADISARLAALGQDKLKGAALKTATANAALGIVMDQTKSSTGEFAKEGDTAAGSSQRLAAWWENLKAKIGVGLLPMFVALVTLFQTKVSPALEQIFRSGGPVATFLQQVGGFLRTQVIPAFSSLWKDLGTKLVPVFAAVGAFLGKTVIPAFRAVWSIVATYVVPIFRTVLTPVINGLGAVFRTVTAKVLEHKDTFVGLYHSLQPFLAFIRDKVAPVVGGAFRIGFEVAGKAIGTVVDFVAGLIDKLKWVLDKGAAVGDFIGNLFSAGGGGGGGGAGTVGAARGLRGAAPGGLFAASRSIGGGGGPSTAAGGLTVAGDTYQITVNGALDPAAVADQIAELLDRRARRVGAFA